jgi:hypothetical protein
MTDLPHLNQVPKHLIYHLFMARSALVKMKSILTLASVLAAGVAAQCPLVDQLQTTNNLVAQTANTLAGWQGTWAGMAMIGIPSVIRSTQLLQAISSISSYNGGPLSNDCADQVLQVLELNHQQRGPVLNGIIGQKANFVALSPGFADAGQVAAKATGFLSDGLHSAIKNAMPDEARKATVQQLWDGAAQDLVQINAAYSS